MKNKLKYTALIFICAFICTSAFTGCGQEEEPGLPPGYADEEAYRVAMEQKSEEEAAKKKGNGLFGNTTKEETTEANVTDSSDISGSSGFNTYGEDIVACKSVEDAREKSGINFPAPAAVLKGYKFSEASIVNDSSKNYIELDYSDGSNTFTYRITNTDSELTRYSETYDKEKEVNYNGYVITCKCLKDDIYIAKWSDKTYHYCIISEVPMKLDTVTTIIDNVK